MAAQNIAENDEEIIDLTELIEKGEAPANDAAVPAGQAEETLSAQIQSLNDLPQQADEEIDALLAQMEVKDDRAPAGEAATTRKVDPNEELDMSGMGEVDKLLDTLDIPPQPHEDGAARAAPAHPADAGIMDSVVDDLLNSMSPTPPAHSGSGQKPDVYDLLSAASDPHATGDALSDDLDALLHDNAPEAKPAPSPSSPRDPEPDLAADLDNLLAAAEKPASPSGVEAPAASKAPDLTADLDSLLASMTSGQGAAPHGAAPEPSKQARAEEKAPRAEAPAVQAQAAATAQPASEAAQPGASADMPQTGPQMEPEIALKTAPESEGEPAADLDSLLAAMSAEQDDAPPSAAPAPTQQARPHDQTQQAEATAAQAQAAATAQPASEAAQPDASADMPETGPQMQPDIALKTAPESEGEPAEGLDSLLAAMSAEEDMSPSPEDTPLTLQGEEDQAAQGATESGHEADPAQASAPQGPAQTAADEEQAFAPEANAELDLDMLLLSPTQQSAGEANAEEEALDAAPASAGSFRDSDAEPLAALDDLSVAAVPGQASPAPADRGSVPLSAKEARESQTPLRGPDAYRAEAEELVSLNVRLRHCEAELADARARIAALERASGAAAASLEDLLRDGSPLHDRFAGLIASSVRQAMQSAPAGITEQVLDERLQAVSLSNKSISARMDALETRLDHLEPRFNAQVEKAAAGAAARILREEIAKLVQS